MPADTSRIIRKLLGLLCFAPLLACSSSSSTTTTITSTFLTVRPSSFRGDIVCGSLPGAWRSYVATLIDVTDPANPNRLASSRPIQCSMPVSFGFGVPSHSYIAEIEGYDRDDIVPFGEDIGALNGSPTGSSRMVDSQTKQDVEPRWKTSCGKTKASLSAYPNATESVYSTDVTVQDCAIFEEQQPPTDAFLQLDLTTIRGALVCGSGKGQIDHLLVVPEDSAFEAVNAQCDGKPKFGPVQAGKDYKFTVSAYEAGSSTTSWVSRCETTAMASVTRPVACSDLSNLGALRIDMAALLAKAQHSCGTTETGTIDGGTTDVLQYRAVLVGAGKPATLLPCGADAVFSSLSPNEYEVMVDAFDLKSQSVFSAFCSGATIPGQVTTANCQVSPP